MERLAIVLVEMYTPGLFPIGKIEDTVSAIEECEISNRKCLRVSPTPLPRNLDCPQNAIFPVSSPISQFARCQRPHELCIF